MYEVISTDGNAKHARFATVHGTVETPLFMNVATAAAIKGGVSSVDLKKYRHAGISFEHVSFTRKDR